MRIAPAMEAVGRHLLPNLVAMSRRTRALTLMLAMLMLLVIAVPALATEGSTETEEETTETTVAPEPVFEDGEPALIIPPEQEEEEEQPWTSRYLYPTIVVLTIILLIGLGIWYNRNIRRKYEVVAD